MFAGYRHCKKCGKALMGLFDGALCDDCEKEENKQMTELKPTNHEMFTKKGTTDKP